MVPEQGAGEGKNGKPTKGAYERLPPQQRKFVDAYLKANKSNATKAALEAGYSAKTAYSQGSRLLKNVEIQAAISEVVGDLVMDRDEVLLRWGQLARLDVSPYIKFVPLIHRAAPPKKKAKAEPEEEAEEEARPPEADPLADVPKVPALDLEAMVGAGYGWAVKNIVVTRHGVNVELHDPFAALDRLGKYHGLVAEKHEHSGPGGGPIPVDLTLAQGQAAEELAEWRKAQQEKLSNGSSVPPTLPTS